VAGRLGGGAAGVHRIDANHDGTTKSEEFAAALAAFLRPDETDRTEDTRASRGRPLLLPPTTFTPHKQEERKSHRRLPLSNNSTALNPAMKTWEEDGRTPASFPGIAIRNCISPPAQ
jgi:hypothetical protein